MRVAPSGPASTATPGGERYLPMRPTSANPHWEQDARLVRERGGWRSRVR